jgi:hypothetical protein
MADPNYCEIAGNKFITTGYCVENYGQRTDIHDNRMESTTTHGIVLRSGASYCNVHDNHIDVSDTFYWVYLLADAGSYNIIHDNIFNPGGTRAYSDLSGLTNYVHHNYGWVTENQVLSGTFAIDAVTTVSVIIAHGCSFTPIAQQCALTIIENTAVDDWVCGYVKIHSINATNVTAYVRITTASATGGATAKLGLKIASLG